MTLEEIEARLHGLELPEPPVYLHESAKITDVQGFLTRQLTILRTNPQAKTSEPARDRLIKFIEIVENIQ